MNWNTSAGNFTPHPAGHFYAICADVYDRVEKNNFYKTEDKQTGKIDMRETVTVAYIAFFTSEGQTVRFKANATLGKPDKPSNLRKFLKAWNPQLTDAHLETFNPESVLGWPAYITVAHRDSKGNTYANIVAAMAPPPNSPVPSIPANFIREKDKGAAQPVATSSVTSDPAVKYAPPVAGQQGADEDDLPF